MSGFSEQHWSHIDARIEFPFEPSTRAEAQLGWRLAAALTEHLSRQPEVRAWLEEMNNRELTDELERTIAEQAVQVCRAHNLPSAFIAALLQQVAIIEVLRKVTDNDVYLELGLYDPVTAKTRQAVKAQLLFVLDRTIELIQQGELERLEGENFFSQVLAWCNAIYQQLTERVTLIQEEMELPPGRKRKDIELREHLERARAFAAQQGLTNVRFEVGNIYKPPAAPESFDVAYTNAVLPTSLTRPARCRLRKAYSRRAD